MNTARILWQALYINLVSYVRVKEALFFSMVFPVFLFTLFGFIWGNNYPGYIANIYLGIIAMTVASDTLFGVGPVIRIYIATGTLKALKILPFNIVLHFIGLAASRLAAILISVLLITICAKVFFDYSPSLQTMLLVFVGLIAGALLFSFMGLLFAFSLKPESGRGAISMVYFLMLFVSGIFYPVSVMPDFLQKIAYVLPLTHLVAFLRGETHYIIYLLLWTAVFMVAFVYRYKKHTIKR